MVQQIRMPDKGKVMRFNPGAQGLVSSFGLVSLLHGENHIFEAMECQSRVLFLE